MRNVIVRTAPHDDRKPTRPVAQATTFRVIFEPPEDDLPDWRTADPDDYSVRFARRLLAGPYIIPTTPQRPEERRPDPEFVSNVIAERAWLALTDPVGERDAVEPFRRGPKIGGQVGRMGRRPTLPSRRASTTTRARTIARSA
jgi:hypothetical protein